ncbi:putative maltose O-acetyltransferase [Hypsibius exemplaris]|uniref:Maltose O-acetyltransferase n=1 Tax=Hypsibius exemplaris TaxID=2072580 RepID=A0A1W0WX49_HYPEX|nr:putative maltose O-acetyltransferase [Hypsibius exemplaris]
MPETKANECVPASYSGAPDAASIQSIKLQVPRIIPSPPNTEAEKMLAGQLYNCMDLALVNARVFAKTCLQRMNTQDLTDVDTRAQALMDLLGTKETGVWIEPPFYCDYGSNIHMGEATYVNVNCTFLDGAPIRIGKRCFFGPKVSIYTNTHPIDPYERALGDYSKPVTIGDDCWVGGSAIILPGITIGEGSTIGAGSVVTKDVAPYTIVAGNPARKIKDVPRIDSDKPIPSRFIMY